MTLPKKREDLERIVEEVEKSHSHEHEHHHHHHGDIEDTVTVLELLVDSLGANVKNLDSRISRISVEISKLYNVLSYIVEAIAAGNDDERMEYLKQALKTLRD